MSGNGMSARQRRRSKAILLTRITHCPDCGRPWSSDVWPTLEHKKPRSLGGTNHIHNLELLCEPCNQARAIAMDLDGRNALRSPSGSSCPAPQGSPSSC